MGFPIDDCGGCYITQGEVLGSRARCVARGLDVIMVGGRSWRWLKARLSGEPLVASLNGMNIVVAFASQMLIYRLLGASLETDTYFAALVVPQILATVLGTTAAGALVPLLSHQNREAQNRLGWALVVVVGGFVVIGAATLIGVAPLWVPTVFAGFKATQRDLCVELVRIQVGALPFIAVNAVLTSILYSRSRFVRVESINLSMSLSVIVGLALAVPLYGVVAASWVYMVRMALQTALLASALDAPHFRGSLADLRQAWRSARVLLAGNTYFKTDILVDRHLLSMATAGSLSLFTLAQSIYTALTAVIGQAWGNTAVPRLTGFWRDNDRQQFEALYRRNLAKIALLAGLILLAIIAGHPLTQLAQGKTFTPATAHRMWVLMLLLSGLLVFGSLGSLIAGCYYAVGDTRTPTVLSIASFSAVVALKLTLFSKFGVVMLCLLTSLHYAFNAVVMMALMPGLLNRRFRS